jgi:hypothetical protein
MDVGSDASNTSTIRNNGPTNINRIETGNNIIRANVSNEEGRTENSIDTSRNQIIMEDRVTTTNNNFNISTLNIHNIRPSQSNPSLSSNILDEIDRLQNNRNVSSTNVANSNTNLLESRQRFNVNRLRKFKSVIDLKNKIVDLIIHNNKVTTFDFPIANTVNNIFEVNKYHSILHSSTQLKSYLLYNKWLLDNSDDDMNILTYLNSIINDLDLFSHIQNNLINIIEHQNTNSRDFNTIKALINRYHLEYYSGNKSELYSNEFNDKLFTKLNSIFGFKLFIKYDINHFNSSKLKEFYIINDFEYLNGKNKDRLLSIELFNNISHFRNGMKSVIDQLILYPAIKNSSEFYRLNTLYESFITKFNSYYEKSTIDNLNLKQNQHVKLKDLHNLKKTRMIDYYYHLFNSNSNR